MASDGVAERAGTAGDPVATDLATLRVTTGAVMVISMAAMEVGATAVVIAAAGNSAVMEVVMGVVTIAAINIKADWVQERIDRQRFDRSLPGVSAR
jgi:hypothetical protein